ncbi:hypothetical protein J2X20_005068 [Pelomonas saccharophila]|uniref:Uncharacterized protein n=1 Tax=Roseateles saccharophilus TaxID=304 RepID=A0ABU1YU46_ROSSA|nr:hypothetical protein [Roseateles saccharophilus]
MDIVFLGLGAVLALLTGLAAWGCDISGRRAAPRSLTPLGGQAGTQPALGADSASRRKS